MAVGPQYQSQLALLAGALGHGLDASTGLDLYQQTIAQADAARQQRQAEIQQTLGQLGQIATQAATSGETPEQVQALVQATKAGLPMAQTQAVRHGVHGILANLADYQATPDPTTQLQMQGMQLDNALKAQQLQQGTTGTPADETLFGPQSMQQVQQAVQNYDAQGLDIQSIRSAIYGQLGIAVDDPLKPVIDKTVSSAYGQLHPQWASSNLAMFGATPPPPPPPPPADHLFADVVGGAALGAGLGTIIPGAGTLAGGALGALGGLIGHAVYGSIS